MNIEIKTDNPPDIPIGRTPPGPIDLARALVDVLSDEGGPPLDPERILVSSFDSRALTCILDLDQRWATGFLVSPMADAKEAIARASGAGNRALHPFVAAVDAFLVDRAHESGLAVHVWTVNGEDDLRRLDELRVDGIITDQLALAQEVVNANRALRGELGSRQGS